MSATEARPPHLALVSAASPSPGWNALGVSKIFGPLAPMDHLIGALDICSGAPSLWAGYGFSGKTAAAQSAAVSIAAGVPVWQRFKARRGRVLHLDYEQGERLTRDRYQRIAGGLGLGPSDLEDRLMLVSMPTVYLDDPDSEAFIASQVEGFDLVIVDSLKAACPTLDENSSAARVPLDRLTRISEKTGTVFVVIHHSRKPSMTRGGGAKMAIRGSSALFDASGSVLIFNGEKDKPKRVSHEKARTSGICADTFQLRIEDREVGGTPRGGLVLSVDTGAIEPVGSGPDRVKAQILDHLRIHGEEPGKNALYKILGGNRAQFLDAVAELIEAGEVAEAGTYHAPVLRLVH
jgi:AAA domain